MKSRSFAGIRSACILCVGMIAGIALPLPAQQIGTMRSAKPVILTYRLENGLDVAIVADQTPGLIRARLVFRGGSSAQTKDNAGIVSLVSGLMRESAAIEESVVPEGVGPAVSSPAKAWDAPPATMPQPASSVFIEPGIDRFIVGLDSTQDGLDASLGALRRVADPENLAALAKGPAMAQARATAIQAARIASLDPASIFEASVNRKLFGKYPWRRDIAGQEKTLAELPAEAVAVAVRASFAPNSALLVLAGDIEPDAAKTAAENAFGSWNKPVDAPKQRVSAFPTPGVTRPTWLVRQDPAIPEGSARVELRYRGPDPDSEPKAARAAVLWAELAGTPTGRFASVLAKSAPGFMKSEGLAVRYVPVAGSAWIGISASLKSDNAASRTQQFKELARNTEMYAMKSNSSYFKAEEYAAARNRLLEARTEALESPEGAGRALADAWILWGLDDYFAFPEALAKTGAKDIVALADTYFMKNLEVVSLGLNPADYSKQKKTLLTNGFEEVSAEKHSGGRNRQGSTARNGPVYSSSSPMTLGNPLKDLAMRFTSSRVSTSIVK